MQIKGWVSSSTTIGQAKNNLMCNILDNAIMMKQLKRDGIEPSLRVWLLSITMCLHRYLRVYPRM